MNSWNNSTSYANNVKVHRLPIPRELQDTCYDLSSTEDFHAELRDVFENFGDEVNYQYGISFNGRSSGYLVLYKTNRETTGHRSRCTKCGQLNFKSVLDEKDGQDPLSALILQKGLTDAMRASVYRDCPAGSLLSEDEALRQVRTRSQELVRKYGLDLDPTPTNKCGRCGSMSRANLPGPLYRVVSYPGKGIDDDADFAEWSMYELRERVRLVQRFDRACDEALDLLIDMAREYEVVDATVMVPKTVRVLRERAS